MSIYIFIPFLFVEFIMGVCKLNFFSLGVRSQLTGEGAIFYDLKTEKMQSHAWVGPSE